LQTTAEITNYLTTAVSAIIQDFAQRLDPAIPAVLAGHLTVSSGVFSGSEKRAIYGSDPLFLPSQLAISPFDYVALGHLHRHQNLNPNGYPALVYSGSLERIDFGERNDEKGFCLVSIPEKNKASFEFIKVPTRPFIQININLQPGRSQTEQLIEAIHAHTITDAILKIVYTIPGDEKDTVNLKAIENLCSSAM
jgi:exonuclease SbcD